MATRETLAATYRELRGKRVKRLRREGLVPGVLYGPAVDQPRAVTVRAREFDQTYLTAGTTALIDLTVAGQTHTAFVRDVQIDPIRRTLVHVEFYAPDLTQPIIASVPVMIVGELASTVDGVLTHLRQDVEVRALPDTLPAHLEADVSGLDDIDSAILAQDLPLPPGVALVTPGDEMVIRVAAPEPVEVVPPGAEQALEEVTGDMPSEVNAGAEPIEKP